MYILCYHILVKNLIMVRNKSLCLKKGLVVNMKTCLNCGKENENLICDKCKNNVDDIISKLTNNFTFFEIYSNNRELFYQSAKICLTNDWLQQDKKEHIIQAIFVNKFKDYNYFEAEEFANIIKTNENINKYVLYELGKYYLYTRRYEIAEKYLGKRLTIMENADDEKIKKAIQKSYDEIEKRKKGLMAEYMPLKPEIQAKYCEFMNSIGFDLERKIEQAPRTRSSLKAKISAEAYPNIKKQEINNFNFDTFVAFDIETTGFKRKKSTLAKAGKIDDIIEIAAIKVINGKIDESSSFKFQELVHPLKQKISKEIETLTGITNEMVYDAKQIYEVFPKFMEFVDDNILVGFNCINFDCDFLIRAGRYSNIIIKNNFFDIYRNLEKLNIKPISLNELSKQYNIINENAHRALSDAVTTAKLYLKLKNSSYSLTEIGKHHGVSYSVIHDINNGVTYIQDGISYPIREFTLSKEKFDRLVFDLKYSTMQYSKLGFLYNLSTNQVKAINAGRSWHKEYIQYPIRQVVFRGTDNKYSNIQRDLLSTNKTFEELAKKYSCSESTIRRINTGETAKNNNFKYPLKRVGMLSSMDIYKIHKLLLSSTMSINEIARKYRVSEPTIKRINSGKTKKYMDEKFTYPLRK